MTIFKNHGRFSWLEKSHRVLRNENHYISNSKWEKGSSENTTFNECSTFVIFYTNRCVFLVFLCRTNIYLSWTRRVRKLFRFFRTARYVHVYTIFYCLRRFPDDSSTLFVDAQDGYAFLSRQVIHMQIYNCVS